MIAHAQARFIRVSAQKVRLIVPHIKGMQVTKAHFLLKALPQKGAFLLHKVLQSAIANAKNKGYDEKSLFVSNALVNNGPVLKRFRACSFGRAGRIRKRTAHIRVEIDSSEKIITTYKKG